MFLSDRHTDQLFAQSGDADDSAFSEMKLRAGLIKDLLAIDFRAHIGGDAVVELGLALDRFQERMLSAQLQQPLFKHLLGVLALRLGDRDAAVVPQFDLRGQRNGRREGDRFASGDLNAGLRHRIEFFLFKRFGQRLRNQPFRGLFKDHVRAERALDDAAGRFALTKSGNPEALRQPPGSLVERFLDAGVIELDFEQHLRLGDAFRGNFHRSTFMGQGLGHSCG